MKSNKKQILQAIILMQSMFLTVRADNFFNSIGTKAFLKKMEEESKIAGVTQIADDAIRHVKNTQKLASDALTNAANIQKAAVSTGHSVVQGAANTAAQHAANATAVAGEAVTNAKNITKVATDVLVSSSKNAEKKFEQAVQTVKDYVSTPSKNGVLNKGYAAYNAAITELNSYMKDNLQEAFVAFVKASEALNALPRDTVEMQKLHLSIQKAFDALVDVMASQISTKAKSMTEDYSSKMGSSSSSDSGKSKADASNKRLGSRRTDHPVVL